MIMMANALSAPTTSVLDAALAKWILEQEEALRLGYNLYEQYYRGDQGTQLTDRQKKYLQRSKTTAFRDNFCEVVVGVMSERLQVIGFESADEKFSEWAWNLWQVNRADQLQNVMHSEVIMKGDAYILVDWDDVASRPRMTYQDPATIIPRYDPSTRTIAWASKKWVWIPEIGDERQVRLNLYYPDRIEKYVAKENGRTWDRFSDEDDLAWPVPWIGTAGEPLGVPIIHFRNRPVGADFGLSELDNTIPLQDGLNKTLIDLAAIMDTQASPQRWTINISSPSSFDSTPGAVWELAPADGDVNATNVGQFEAAPVEPILKGIEMWVQHIAGRSRTPQHLFQIGSNYPSGEALKTAESGLVEKVKLRQTGFGNSWEDCLTFALRLQNKFGEKLQPVEDALLQTLWKDPETRNEENHLAALERKRNLGVSQRQIWRELGYDESQITQMEEDLQDQRVADANIGAAILDEFNRGRGGQ